MKVGLVVDGMGEIDPFFQLCQKLQQHGLQVVRPDFANMQPKASPAQIAKAANSAVNVLKSSKKVDRIVVLIDRENNPDCSGNFAESLCAAFDKIGHVVEVVVKDRQFENWLIADPKGIQQLTGLFKVDGSFISSVSPNKADHVRDPVSLINRIILKRNREYHKRKDPQEIVQKIDPFRMSKNSRSFRKFLRTLNVPEYAAQSALP